MKVNTTSEIQHLFVPFEVADKLKSIGLDVPCFAGYQKNGRDEITLYFKPSSGKSISPNPSVYGPYCHQNNHVVKAPLYQQVFDWFRERGYNSAIHEEDRNDWSYIAGIGTHDTIGGIAGYDTFVEAQNECIKNLIEYYEKNN